jgi:glycosyltransferase involved in cell wall biosynthesis
MRALKFVKYLPQYGWKPVVLTVQPQFYRLVDDTLLEELPEEAEITHTKSWEPKGRSYQRVLNTYHNSPHGVRDSLRRFRRRIYGNLLVHQDEEFLWLPHAWRAANRLLREQRVDVILTTSPPHCAQWLGLALKKKHRLPWVVDLRDGWLSNTMFRSGFAPRYWVEQQVERAVVSASDCVIAATEPIREDLVQSYPLCSDKLTVLTNGFDPADFQGLVANRRSDYLDVTYVGSIGGTRRPIEPLFRAIAELLVQASGLGQVLRLHFVGSFGPTEVELVEQYGLASVVAATGWVDHREAIQHMLDAQVLLVISSDLEGGKDVLTGKVFEYVAAERPILALAPRDAAVSRLVLDNGLGIVTSPSEVDEIVAALRTLYLRFQEGTLDLPENPLLKKEFSRVDQTESLAGILAKVKGRVSA